MVQYIVHTVPTEKCSFVFNKKEDTGLEQHNGK